MPVKRHMFVRSFVRSLPPFTVAHAVGDRLLNKALMSFRPRQKENRDIGLEVKAQECRVLGEGISIILFPTRLRRESEIFVLGWGGYSGSQDETISMAVLLLIVAVIGAHRPSTAPFSPPPTTL